MNTQIESNQSVTKDAFRNGMALLAGAVTVLTTNGPEGLAGITASAVCSVTDSPPTVLVCINRSSFAHRFFYENKVLCINVLGAHQRDLSAMFSNRNITMTDRFSQCQVNPLVTGAPALEQALVNLDGRIVATHEVGTHSVFYVEIDDVRMTGEPVDRAGLAYFDRQYHYLEHRQG